MLLRIALIVCAVLVSVVTQEVTENVQPEYSESWVPQTKETTERITHQQNESALPTEQIHKTTENTPERTPGLSDPLPTEQNERLTEESKKKTEPTTEEYEVLFSYDEGENEELNKQVEVSYGCPVNNRLPCVAKCCDLKESHASRESMKNGSDVCVQNPNFQDFHVHFEDFPDRNDSVPVQYRYEYFIGVPCSDKKYVLDPEKYPDDAYSIYANGSLFHRGQIFSMSDYCLDTVDGEFKVFFCFDSASAGIIEFFHVLYPAGQILSIIFLIATAATYLGCEELRDLQGKILVCHIFCLIVAFVFLATVQLSGSTTDRSFCVVAAFIIQFSFIACFFWLNVLSYDTYCNLRDHFRSAIHSGTARRLQMGNSHMPRSERRQFIVYSLYAWNGPLILLVVSLVLDNVPGIPNNFLKPNFGVKSCWFGSETAALPYFFGPMGVLLCINLVFFALSAHAVFKEKKADNDREMANRRESEAGGTENNKRRRWRRVKPYILAMKQCGALFVIMGLSWMTEVISWAAGGSKYIWITTDVINTLQGLLIFYVFVLRPENVRDALKKKLALFWGIMTHCDYKYRPVPVKSDGGRRSTDRNAFALN